jgi:hypothetical protein
MNKPPTYEWLAPDPHEAPKPPGPFTISKLREMVERSPRGTVVHAPPNRELASLATHFNRIDHLYEIRKEAAINRARAAKINRAMWELMRFFDERRRTCKAPRVPPEIAEGELRLGDQFDSFKAAMMAHAYMLPMDMGLGAWPYKNWHDFASWIAYAWVPAMEKGNPGGKFKFGPRNTDGIIAWLTAETIGIIVGRTPLPSTVAQHIKQPRPRKRPRAYSGKR